MRILKLIIRCCQSKKMIRTIIHRDKKICKTHPEWNALSKSELQQIDSKEKWSYMIYKNLTGTFTRDFVSDARYQLLFLPKLNSNDFCGHFHPTSRTDFSDKNYHEFFMQDIKFPNTVLRNIGGQLYDKEYHFLRLDEACKLINMHDNLVVKTSNGAGHGVGVSLMKAADVVNIVSDINEIDYIVQEVVRQHESFAYYNDSSVNVVRMTSLLYDGEVHVLGAILRIGAPGSFCDHLANEGKNPLVVPINADGSLVKKAFDCYNYEVKNDVNGKTINDTVYGYEKMVSIVKRSHNKFAGHRLIGWDFTVDSEGEIVCIEYNSFIPGVIQSQYAVGPFFGIEDKNGKKYFEDLLYKKL